MGAASTEKDKYFLAYRSIKCVLDLTHNITSTVDNIYFVNVATIPNYLAILNKYNILNMITDITKKFEINNIEKRIYDEFGDYKLEPYIEILDINAHNIEKYILGEKEFILVDKDFLINMNIEKMVYKGKEHKIIVKKNERYIELSDYDEEKIIVNLIEIENKAGIYKFKIEESDDFSEASIAGDVKREIERKYEDPEVGLFRTKPWNDKIFIMEESKENTNDNNNNLDYNNLNNLIQIDNSSIINKIITKRAPPAKLDEIVYNIYSSLSNNGGKDIIFKKIKHIFSALNIQNELEETGIDIIGNIKTLVIYLIESCGLGSQNLINLNQSIDESDENSFFIQIRNDEDIHRDNNENFNPFEFWQIKFIDCKKCNIKETQRFLIEFYKINVNKECNNVDDCFKLSFLEICSKHNINAICNYKFDTTPEILILKFENPKMNKNYIKFKQIEKNIDLKNYMYLPNNFNIKYELIEVFFVYDDLNDKKLYVDILENERSNYIPYILFYKKINTM